MPNFTVFGSDSVAKALTSFEEGVVASNGNLVTTGTAVDATDNARLHVLGNIVSTGGDAYQSTGDGVDLVTVGENGSMLGYSDAIEVSKATGSFFLHNLGFISNPNSQAVDVDFSTSGSFRVINTGTITAFNAALEAGLVSGNSQITNSGTIMSMSGSTINTFTTGSDSVNNSGLISHNSLSGTAISAGNGTTTILNTGEIAGRVFLRDGDDVYNGIKGLQTYVNGGADNDIIYTSDSQEELFGGTGNDRIFGNGGGDEIFGGDGNDIMRGGAEADDFDGGADTDWVYYQNSNASVSVDLTSGFGFGGDAEGDTYVDVENVFGTAGRDELNGSGENNYLVGGNGNDIMRGYDGNDQFRGDAGADVMNGGAGLDRLVYAASNSAVNVNMTTGTASGGHATGDRFFNMEYLTGSSYGDRLTGSTAGNQIFGLDGDDIIRGYFGNDLMNGGGGADTFVFDNNGGNDIIVAFENDVDKLDLSVYNYASVAQVLANTTTSGADVFITFDANDSIRLVGFAPNIGDLSDDLIL